MDIFVRRESKKQKLNEDDDHLPGNKIKPLPRDICLDILSRLPVKSLVQFRFVCRTFYNLTCDPNLIQMHLFRSAYSKPCLIFHSDYPLNNQLHFVEYPDHESKEGLRKIKTPFSTVMPEFEVVGSCNGVLCLANSLFSNAVCIYNPFTRQYLELPRSVEFQHQEVIYGFGFHPVMKEYKVIKIIYYEDFAGTIGKFARSEVQVFSLGSGRWKSIGQIPHRLDRESTDALVHGRLHWAPRYITLRGLIISFDFSDDVFRDVPLPDHNDQDIRGHYHLAVLSGCLSVGVPNVARWGGLEIWIMKQYNVKESWVKQFCVGAYSPKLMAPEILQSRMIWRNVLRVRITRVLCLLDNGEILLQYRGGALVSYNPETGTFKNLTFQGMPRLFQVLIHVGSLNWIA